MQGFDWFWSEAERGLHRGQIAAMTRIVMKTIILPSGNASAWMIIMASLPQDETHNLSVATLFLVWVTLTEHKWVILGNRRGALTSASDTNCNI
jgi:hypothetical protein